MSGKSVKNMVLVVGLISGAAISCFAAMNSNVVGFQGQIIRKGAQELKACFYEVSTGTKYTVGDLLRSAVEGDSIAYGDFQADARWIDGALHWVRGGEIVDKETLPDPRVAISYFRAADKVTELNLAGGVDPEVFDEPPRKPNEQPAPVVKPAPKKPETYMADAISYTTVPISNDLGHGKFKTGTGFFFTFNLPKTKSVLPAIVSNRHVAEGATNTIFTFTLKCADGVERVKKYRVLYHNTQWQMHPVPKVDLAFLPLLPILSAVRSELNAEVRYLPFSVDTIPTDEDFWGLTQMDDVYMVGYPNGIYDEEKNQPIFRKGAISTRPSMGFGGERKFLIDMAVCPGSSGSPVILADETSFLDRKNRCVSMSGRIKLLGVVCEVYQRYADMKIRPVNIADVGVSVAGIPTVPIPINLGVVIHASRLKEIEDSLRETFDRAR